MPVDKHLRAVFGPPYQPIGGEDAAYIDEHFCKLDQRSVCDVINQSGLTNCTLILWQARDEVIEKAQQSIDSDKFSLIVDYVRSMAPYSNDDIEAARLWVFSLLVQLRMEGKLKFVSPPMLIWPPPKGND